VDVRLWKCTTLYFIIKTHWWNTEQSANLAESGLLVKATFFNGCENREQMQEDQNARTSYILLNPTKQNGLRNPEGKTQAKNETHRTESFKSHYRHSSKK
jgi:hypothetical protein